MRLEPQREPQPQPVLALALGLRLRPMLVPPPGLGLAWPEDHLLIPPVCPVSFLTVSTLRFSFALERFTIFRSDSAACSCLPGGPRHSLQDWQGAKKTKTGIPQTKQKLLPRSFASPSSDG